MITTYINSFLKIVPVFLFLISCAKSNESLQPTGQYKSSTTASVSNIKMYAGQSEIINPTIIQSFLQQKDVDEYFIFGSSSTSVNNFLTINFLQNNNVHLLLNDASELIQAKGDWKSPSQFLITYNDSISISLLSGFYAYCTLPDIKVGQTDPPKIFYPLPSVSGYSGFFRFRPSFPLLLKNDQLILPLMTYLLTRSDANTYCFDAARDVWDIFNTEAIEQLDSGDTLVYQMKYINLLRQ